MELTTVVSVTNQFCPGIRSKIFFRDITGGTDFQELEYFTIIGIVWFPRSMNKLIYRFSTTFQDKIYKGINDF